MWPLELTELVTRGIQMGLGEWLRMRESAPALAKPAFLQDGAEPSGQKGARASELLYKCSCCWVSMLTPIIQPVFLLCKVGVVVTAYRTVMNVPMESSVYIKHLVLELAVWCHRLSHFFFPWYQKMAQVLRSLPHI